MPERLSPVAIALVEANVELAYKVSRRHIRDPWMPPDDCVSIASEGLVMAALKFDPTKGHEIEGEKFVPYAVMTIQHHFQDYVRRNYGRKGDKAIKLHWRTTSLDKTFIDKGGEEKTLYDVLTDENAHTVIDHDLMQEDLKSVINRGILTLSGQTKALIIRRYIGGETGKAIGLSVDLSEGRVSQILKEGLIKLRLFMVAEGYER